MDILCGEYGKRMFIYYGDGNGSVSGGGPITDADGSEEFGFDRFNGPALIDMNGDGLSDMLVSNCNSGTYVDGGDDPGPLRYYENVGEVGASLFKLIEYVTDTTGTEIRHVYQRVYVADMDNDGLDDIITANTRDKDSETDTVSRVMIYRNCGTDNEARFEPGVAVDLRLADGSTPLWYAIRLGVTDINNDGVQDIIVNSSTHFPGKAGIYYGQLDPVSNGRNVYSVQPSQMLFSLNGTTLELEQASDLSLINASGRVVASEQGVVNNVDLQQFNLAPGVHFLQVQQGEEFQTQKVHLQ